MPTSELSPSMNRYATGLRCVRQILTFLPIRLASMRPSTLAIVEFSSTIEFSISQCSSWQPLPIDVYGPTYACDTRAPRPMIDGPRTTESLTSAPSSITTLPSMALDPAMLPRTSRSNVSSTVRFASSMSSILPVSFHQPLTMCGCTRSEEHTSELQSRPHL